MKCLAALISLTLLAAPAAAQVEAPSTADPGRIVCKKVQLTGSLLRKAKDCRPAHQWERPKALATARPAPAGRTPIELNETSTTETKR
jgi:hypothetical protein